MITPSSGTVTFGEQFSVTISITTESTEEGGTPVPGTTIPDVTASFNDPGVTILAEEGQVTISGKYTSIIPIPWTYIDLTGNVVTSTSPPDVGKYEKITGVESPSSLTATCTYTIDSDSFVHTVTLGSYSSIANTLQTLLAGAK